MDKYGKYYKIISKSPLFSGMKSDEIEHAIALMKGSVKSCRKGEIVHHAGKRFMRFGMVLAGTVQACCDDLDGNRMIMAEVQPGITFGESLHYLKTGDSHVYIYASEAAEVLWLSLDDLYKKENDDEAAKLIKRFTNILATRALAQNSRIQVLSKILIRDKLMTYFNQLALRSGSNEFTVPLNREDMATYIGANRSALSRELARMKDEGIIDYYGKSFRIIGNEK